jgi:ABC-type sugar transport system substrate-binding protein
VNQAISQKYDGIILSQGRDPYSTALVKKAVDAGIKVAVFDTAVNGEIPGVTVTQQDDASLTESLLRPAGERFQRQGQYRQAVGGGLPADGAPSGGV